jgi:hypothetical protein
MGTSFTFRVIGLPNLPRRRRSPLGLRYGTAARGGLAMDELHFSTSPPRPIVDGTVVGPISSVWIQ